MLRLFRTLLQNDRLVRNFVRRDLRARYVGSSLGFFWSVLYPIVNLAIYMFVFSVVLQMRWAENQGSGEVALVMLTGIVVWAAFAESITRVSNCLVDSANLIQKVVFPSEILPVYIVLSTLVNMAIALPIVLAGVAWFAYVSPEVTNGVTTSMALGPQMIALPLLMLLQAGFTIGLGYALATLNVYWRDTFHLIGVFVVVWMFVTPIFYPAFFVRREGFGFVLDANPMHWLIEQYRRILLYAEWPDWRFVAQLAAVTISVLYLGSKFFLAQKRRFPDLL